MKILQIILIAILFPIMMTNVYSMRCGTQLVLEGESKFDLQKKCGQPDDVATYQESIPLYNQAGYQIGVTTRTVDKWYYQKSSADFKYEILFSDGVIKEINASR